MSKFTDLSDAVRAVRQKWIPFREACMKDAVTIVNGFAAHCEIPLGSIFLSPMNKDHKEGVTYTMAGAWHYDGDGFWHFGFGLALSGELISVEVCLTRRKGKTVIKLFSDGVPREIDLSHETERNSFYDFMVKEIISYF